MLKDTPISVITTGQSGINPLGPRVLPVLYTRGFVANKLSISFEEANGGGFSP
ncbi:MAG: hypothetical protein CM15mV19_1480 [uncultured marine virus]|nr:MAG: hypothetical protein CM15mV19_1480 [uncultured marine virus]